MGGDPGKLLADKGADVCLRGLGSTTELWWHGVGTKPGGDDVHGSLQAKSVGHLHESELRIQVQAVAGLRLDRRHAMGQHLVRPTSAVGHELALRGGPCRGHRGEDPATRCQDVEIGRATPAEFQFTFPTTGEQQMRMRIDEAGRDRAAPGIQPGKPRERVATAFQRGFDREARTDRQDPTVPTGDHRGIRASRVVRGHSPDEPLLRPAADTARHGHDLTRPGDQEPGRGLAGSTTFDDAE